MSQQPPPPPGWASPPPGSPAQYPPQSQQSQGQGVWAAPVVVGGQSYPAVSSPAPRSGGSLAVWLAGSALVVAVIALLVALAALFGSFSPFGPGMGPNFDDVPSGTVPGAVVSQTLSGDRIGYSVVDALLAMGADIRPGAIECETVLRLDAGSTSDCHGTVDGDDSWSGQVEFTDSPGEFFLYEE